MGIRKQQQKQKTNRQVVNRATTIYKQPLLRSKVLVYLLLFSHNKKLCSVMCSVFTVSRLRKKAIYLSLAEYTCKAHQLCSVLSVLKNPNKQSTGVYKLLLSNRQYLSDNQHRMINTFTPIIQRIISDGAARLHIAAYCDRDFSSMAWIHDQVDRLLISMELDDSDVQRARTVIADTFVTYVHVYNIEVDGDIDL